MKPIVFYVTNKEIKLTREEFEDYINDAYEAGRKEGYNEGVANCRRYDWWNIPITTTPNPTITWDTNKTPIDPYKVTCCGDVMNAVGD